jgi:hypothetical protein
VSFPLEVALANHAPTATVELSSIPADVYPTSVLTAAGIGADADGDPVTLAYSWTRNGLPVDNPGPKANVLDLAGIAQPGDVIAVTVMPSDPHGEGHATSAAVLVKAPVVPPASPRITATATTASGPYVVGTWSRTMVTVHFECTSGAPVISCPIDVQVSDTGPDGQTVPGEMTDMLGRTDQTQITVLADGTAPTLAPTVTPDPVLVGATASAAPHASDAGSGIASQSCDIPSTLVPGLFSVTCRAADVAGNTSSTTVAYTVSVPPVRMCLANPDRAPLAPMNADGSSVFERASGIPIVFAACDAAGKPIGTKNLVKSVTQVSSTALPPGAVTNEQKYPPAANWAYNSTTGVWTGYLQASKLSQGRKYVFTVLLSDGTSFLVTFGVR